MSQHLPDDITVFDDDLLLADGLLRACHKAADGHIAPNQQMHRVMVEPTHNMLVLYVYYEEEDGNTMREYHVWSKQGKSYDRWSQHARAQAAQIAQLSDSIIGVYGWSTRYVAIEFLRQGDVLTNITRERCKFVRMTKELFTHARFASDTETQD